MPARLLMIVLLLTAGFMLGSCHEPVNPLLGNWKHAGAGVQEQQQVITFTPSTMVIDGRRVTVVYQIRPDKVRVSASRKAIVYDLVDENTIRYRDDDGNVFVLKRVDGGG